MIYIFLLIAFLSIFLGYYKFHSILNPVSFFSLSFIVQIFLYEIMNALLLQNIHFAPMNMEQEILQLYSISMIGFSIPWLFVSRQRYIDMVSINNNTFIERRLRTTQYFELSIILLVIFLIVIFLGNPLLQMIRGQISINDLNNSINSLPFGVLGVLVWFSFTALIRSIIIIISPEGTFPITITKLAKISILIIFIASIIYGKRQILFSGLFFYGVMLLTKSDVDLKRILKFVFYFILFYFIYITIQFLRTNGLGDGSGQVFLFELPLAFLWPLLNLDRLVEFYIPDFQLQGLVSQIIPNRLFGHNIENINYFMFEPTASYSLLFYAYKDFGINGVFFVSFFVGILIILLSFRWKGIFTFYITRLLCLWATITSAFYSHAISNNYFLIPILITIILYSVNGSKKRKVYD